ncbi:nuclear cap-binding protein subunit 3-like isoform X1 [Oncorhynchus tshawytscha]|uniref:Nuclear cap-binding protein subunit 3 n=1 Tax=Oncorhynchus tshawytscha TaxID=74940 RepID=A0A8C8LQQ7_ONCTS|nr:nuclear cap-binding protein subunit 3-like isoform X1 [Oncorhynchus tshawytscha]
MAAVRSLRVSVKSDCSDSDSDRDAREFEPMEVEEGELEAEDIPVNRSLNEVLPEAIERTEKSTESFHFCAQANPAQIVVLDRDTMKKAIPNLRLEALHVAGVDDMSTQDVFGYFKEYPPAHIEWIDDASCNVVWLDDVTSTRALINISHVPDPEVVTKDTDDTKELGDPTQESKARGQSDSDDDDGEVEEEQKEPVKENREESEGKASEGETEEKTESETTQVDLLSQAEIESLLRNDLRPATKPFKGNRLFLRLATHDDKKELGAARKSRYYMKYGNPNYGGMRGILSNSWKRRYHTRRIVSKSKKPLIGDSMGDTPPYKHSHSADLINLPEEPIEEEDDDEEGEEDMDSDDRVVEYKEKGERGRVRVGGPVVALWSRLGRPSSPSVLSDSDEMDYDLELKMISTPSPKKSMKMAMYADEVETNLRTIRHSAVRRDSGSGGSGIRNRIGGGSVGETKSSAVEKVIDVRQLLEEKRRGLSQHKHCHPVASIGSTDVRQRLGKRLYSSERRHSTSPVASRDSSPPREPITDVHRRLGVVIQDTRGLHPDSSKDRKSSRLWNRLGPSSYKGEVPERKPPSHRAGSGSTSSRLGGRGEEDVEKENDSALQKVWGALIKQKEQQTHKMKRSRLDNLPSLQIEISRESSNGSDSDS